MRHGPRQLVVQRGIPANAAGIARFACACTAFRVRLICTAAAADPRPTICAATCCWHAVHPGLPSCAPVGSVVKRLRCVLATRVRAIQATVVHAAARVGRLRLGPRRSASDVRTQVAEIMFLLVHRAGEPRVMRTTLVCQALVRRCNREKCRVALCMPRGPGYDWHEAAIVTE